MINYFEQFEEFLGAFSPLQRVRWGFYAAVLVFCLLCIKLLPDSFVSLRRPFKGFWKMVSGLMLLYVPALLFLFFQTKQDVRMWLGYIFPGLGKPLPERNYAEHCELYTPDLHHPFAHFKATLEDEFALAHLCGWVIKSFIMRDPYLMWVLSVVFELLELTFRHQLPNFYECWWDQVILDIFLCNALGIHIGMFIVKLVGAEEHRWVVFHRDGKWHWPLFSCPSHFALVIFYMFFESMVDLNVFFLKYFLWVPPSHPLVLYRIFAWAFWAILTTKDYDRWLKGAPMSGALFTVNILNFMEIFIWMKWSGGEFKSSMPVIYQIIWAGIFSLVALTWLFLFIFRRSSSHSFKSYSTSSSTSSSPSASAASSASASSLRHRNVKQQ